MATVTRVDISSTPHQAIASQPDGAETVARGNISLGNIAPGKIDPGKISLRTGASRGDLASSALAGAVILAGRTMRAATAAATRMMPGAVLLLGMLAAAGVLATGSGSPAHAQSKPADAPGYQSHPGQTWTTAPTPRGAISWDLLGQTKEVEKVDANRFSYVAPVFPDAVKNLNGKTIRINGYMMPLEESKTQNHFILMAYPPSCPFCMTAGPAFLIEVKASKPFNFSYDAVLVEGKMNLIYRDDTGFFYRLTEARPVPARTSELRIDPRLQ